MHCSRSKVGKYILCGIILFNLSLVSTVYGNVLMSVSKLKLLQESERHMKENLRHFVLKCAEDSLHVEETVIKFLDYLDSVSNVTSRPDYLENPLNAFHFLRRLQKQWIDTNNLIDTKDCQLSHPCHVYAVRNKRQERYQEEEGLATTDEDVQQAALALVRLRQTYNLDLGALIRGEILDTRAEPLSVDEVQFICTQLQQQQLVSEEGQWLKQLHASLLPTSRNEENIVVFRRTSTALASFYFRHGMPWMSTEIIKQTVSVEPNNESLRKALEFYDMKANEMATTSNESQSSSIPVQEKSFQESLYEALCRGEGRRSVRELSKLVCVYRRTPVPIYLVKEEIFSYSPRVSLFYDAITKEEMKYLKNLGLQRMVPAKVLNPNPTSERPHIKDLTVRVSQVAWAGDEDSDVVRRLSRRVELITGLSTKHLEQFSHAEYLQIQNYGVGGMYRAHDDTLGMPIDSNLYRQDDPHYLKYSGDRIATWMFYLNDIKAGGSTVFTELNVTVPVVQGAAAFWYNYLRDGSRDTRTKHAGCPVLLGSKWVANKWIRQTGQIFRRKCGRKPESIDPIWNSLV